MEGLSPPPASTVVNETGLSFKPRPCGSGVLPERCGRLQFGDEPVDVECAVGVDVHVDHAEVQRVALGLAGAPIVGAQGAEHAGGRVSELPEAPRDVRRYDAGARRQRGDRAVGGNDRLGPELVDEGGAAGEAE